MKLLQLITPFENLSLSQKLVEVRGWRHRREIERPAAKAIVKRAKKKEVNMQVVRLKKLLGSLPKKELAELLAQLEKSDVHSK